MGTGAWLPLVVGLDALVMAVGGMLVVVGVQATASTQDIKAAIAKPQSCLIVFFIKSEASNIFSQI